MTTEEKFNQAAGTIKEGLEIYSLYKRIFSKIS